MPKPRNKHLPKRDIVTKTITGHESKIDLSQALEMRFKNKLSFQAIADVFGVSKQAVMLRIKRFDKLIGCPEELEQFDNFRDKMLTRIQIRYGEQMLTESVAKRAGAKDAALVMGIAYDKQRLERGLSTQNSAVILASAVVEADRLASVHPAGCPCDRCKQSDMGVSLGASAIVDAEIVDSNQ